jgi:uncharacterized protein
MTWMITATGRKVHPAALEPQDICAQDIAQHLAKICRFTGASRIHWSVAEHSMLVADILTAKHPHDYQLQLCGLLHDAPEAYLQDLATPVKSELLAYHALERAAWWAVTEHFGLPLQMPAEVKHADLVALATEKRDLMPAHPEPWSVLDGIAPVAYEIGAVESHWRLTAARFMHYLADLRGRVANPVH